MRTDDSKMRRTSRRLKKLSCRELKPSTMAPRFGTCDRSNVSSWNGNDSVSRSRPQKGWQRKNRVGRLSLCCKQTRYEAEEKGISNLKESPNANTPEKPHQPQGSAAAGQYLLHERHGVVKQRLLAHRFEQEDQKVEVRVQRAGQRRQLEALQSDIDARMRSGSNMESIYEIKRY